MTGGGYSSIEDAQILLFEDNKGLVFVDFDDDGYRSGNWYLMTIKNLPDKGNTKDIKKINSIVKEIEYHVNHSECIIIVTNEYVIKMGQDRSDNYYPRNFFTVEECKLAALGEIVEMPEQKRNSAVTIRGIEMSSTDCIDICEIVLSVMCTKCPNYKKCQNVEDEANHEQMETCLMNGVLSNPSDGLHGFWPTKFEPMEVDEDES